MATSTTALHTLEQQLLTHKVEIESWFRQQWQRTRPPFYGSVDLRNAGFKLSPVDTNIFPAGFNNLNPEFMPLYVQAVQATLAEICPDAKNILLIPESHTRNPFYLESVAMLQEIVSTAGFGIRIGSMIEDLTEPTRFETPSGKVLLIEPLKRDGKRVGVGDYSPCCIILNNDLSGGIPDMLSGIEQTVMPAMELGWASRLKSEHFRFYQQVAEEFAEHMQFDPWLITPWFDQCPEVNFSEKSGQVCLQERATKLFARIRRKYQEYEIEQEPFLVVKADQGTYGMAVMMIRDPAELSQLNRKQRTRMSTIKGGVSVTRAIIQEGVYSFETAGEEHSVAEPVLYLFGRHVLGGFYRVHKNRGPDENLNAPGMDFLPLPFSKTCNMPGEGWSDVSSQFYIYGMVARLAQLAAARELNAFKG